MQNKLIKTIQYYSIDGDFKYFTINIVNAENTKPKENPLNNCIK